jgi:hypothetical protein
MFMDRDDVAFPDANEIAPHAIAFARMMFAHAEFEREVRLLVDAINPKKPGFGERPENQWTASESGTGKIIILIKYHRGSGLPQIVQIKNLLNEAIHPCRDRNFLAHGNPNERRGDTEAAGIAARGSPNGAHHGASR